ncbi:hypothetical protein DQ04_06081040 [Trypanosoma grayi]|uniref:hypothetical protein n=1 Tax=Trypanosoma grayi TaxID=71804 RepID=UPI0004F43DF5|nr:hypothetical protein DQ04_06081040 [Trypanosoma grayi]KEG08967.1 hypothetical protein DQ04_06081040 [Trypanosoma grayi]
MFGLSGVQQQQPLSRGRRCLYCQQHGCQGIQNCWWPRVRKPTTKLHRDTDAGSTPAAQGAPGAMEENLRAQIRVLECEVQLLRSGLGNIAAVRRRGQADAATMTSDVYFTAAHPTAAASARRDGGSGTTATTAGVSSPSLVLIPPILQGNTHYQQQQQQKQSVKDVTTTQADSPPVVQPDHASASETQRVDGLEQLVRELVRHNTTLCRDLAEATAVVEQRDTLLRSLLEERPSVATHLSPALSPTPTTSFTPSQEQQQDTTLVAHLLRAQEEVAHLRAETQRMSAALESCEAELKRGAAEVEGLRRQVGQIVLPPSGTGVVEQATAPSVVAASTGAVPPPVVTPDSKSKGPGVSDATSSPAGASVWQETSSANATGLAAEVCDLRVKLESAERKVLAWETWYRQEQQQQQQQQPSSEVPQPHPQEAPTIPPERRCVGETTKEAKQQRQRVVLRAVPLAAPTQRIELHGIPAWREGSSVDTLAMDTYALMAREAAWREMARQQQDALMAELLTREGGRGRGVADGTVQQA